MTIHKVKKSCRVAVVVMPEDSETIFNKTSVGGGDTDLLIVGCGETKDRNTWLFITGSEENLRSIEPLVIRDMQEGDQMF